MSDIFPASFTRTKKKQYSCWPARHRSSVRRPFALQTRQSHSHHERRVSPIESASINSSGIRANTADRFRHACAEGGRRVQRRICHFSHEKWRKQIQFVEFGSYKWSFGRGGKVSLYNQVFYENKIRTHHFCSKDIQYMHGFSARTGA